MYYILQFLELNMFRYAQWEWEAKDQNKKNYSRINVPVD